MKYGFFALLAASTTLAHGHHAHRHRRGVHPEIVDILSKPADDCVCSTYVTTRVHTVTVPITVPVGAPEVTKTVFPIVESPKPYISEVPIAIPSHKVPVCPGSPECPQEPAPTPDVITAVTPGVYTIPAKTVTLTKTATVVVPKVTPLTPGPNTYGGVTTIVKTATTVTCPVATEVVEDDVTISKVVMTTYVCPTPGTYHIGATTTSVLTKTEVVCPEVTEYAPGTYSHPETVVTITKTSQVYICPLEPVTSTSAINAPPTSVPTSTPSKPEDKPEDKPEGVPEVKPSIPAIALPSVTLPSSVAPPKETSVITNPGSSGDHWAIVYSPYNDDRNCKTKEQVDSDISEIASKHFKAVRVYESACSTLENVGNACAANGLKMIVGIDHTKASVDLPAVVSWARWELVDLIVVGNEAIFGGWTVDQLAGLISSAKEQLRGAGYTGPVTTAEIPGNYQSHSALCSLVDIVGANIQPYFSAGTVAASEAGGHVIQKVNELKTACQGKEVRVLEAGWPSSGEVIGMSIPSISEQELAIKDIREKAGSITTFFTFRNDGWKGQPVEQSFGCGQFF